VRAAIAIPGLLALALLLPSTLTAADAGDTAARVAAADPARGKISFLQCAACHVAERGQGQPRLGPNLWDVVGRPVASVTGYAYSDAFRALGGAWTYQRLDDYLRAPMSYAPGTRMVFPGIEDAAVRAAVIAFLRTRSDAPAPLPSAAATATASAAPARDPFGAEWPQGPARDIAGHVCNTCHSLAMVTQQRLARWRWDELLDWMVDEQGMPPLSAEHRALVLDYLVQHFGFAD